MTDNPQKPVMLSNRTAVPPEERSIARKSSGRAESEILSLPPLDEPPPPRYVRPGVFGVLDIGSTKMTCLIGRAETNGMLRILGYGWRRSHGIRNGTVIDFAEAERAIRATVGQAEEAADRRLDEVTINLSCGQPTSNLYNARMPIGGREVTEADMERVVAEGQMRAVAEGRSVIHTMPIGFIVDDIGGLVDPRGQLCEQLTARLHVVDAASNALATLTSAVSRAELKVRNFVSAPFASGLAVLAEDERDLGATVIDMGGGTTSIAVFGEGALLHTSFIPVGGLHVTRDLAGYLSVSLDEAERLKTKYGAADVAIEDSRDTFPVQLIGERTGSLNRVSRARLVTAIRPRIEETLELVRDRLAEAGFGRASRERVVITGGASLLEGLGLTAARILNRPVRLGRPMHISGLPETGANAAGFATASGLLAWATGADANFKDAYSPEPRTQHALLRFIQRLRG
ncbi:cell division protein FtsA [Candidatus Kirkpatrickella diaphorinae]|uniref:Cell division protein FtsA n=1 Tax=Candidatus Kirkpatrickella diaphorinae TaxID=2984322 RepID=A0ABY6GJQ6_9PROT|nr:cell division protein FtsA [Candidatus Kirkpatrickella diaphorinae]UYH51675.1 cell division protein FtsA [Candidatus Kirkpatrickella diaphorinae]